MKNKLPTDNMTSQPSTDKANEQTQPQGKNRENMAGMAVSFVIGGMVNASIGVGIEYFKKQTRGARRQKMAVRMEELRVLQTQIMIYCNADGTPLDGKETYVHVLREQALKWEVQIAALARSLEDY